jgi:hypothetical protein
VSVTALAAGLSAGAGGTAVGAEGGAVAKVAAGEVDKTGAAVGLDVLRTRRSFLSRPANVSSPW